MYKDELIHLHQLLVYLMNFLVDNGVAKSYFDEYMSLDISPHHIQKRKMEHKHAVLILASGISIVLADNQEIVPRGVANRLNDMAKRCVAEL